MLSAGDKTKWNHYLELNVTEFLSLFAFQRDRIEYDKELKK